VTVTETDGYAVRRRTEAFTWNREIFRQWANGGSCWLDHDPHGGNDDGGAGSFTALQHVYSSFTATALNQNGAISKPGFPPTPVYNNNSVLREGNLQQKENAATHAEPGVQSTQCLHDSQSAVNENRSLQIPVQSGNKIPEHAPMTYSNCCKTAEMSPDSTPSAVNKDQPRSIRAADYKKLEPPEPKTVCYACGKKGSWFIEKFTKERRARPKDQQDARRVCRSCYNEAMKAEQMAAVPLPGTVDVSRCSRVTADVGKCSVCGIAKASWIDRETGVKLCEHCYGRGLRESAREAGVV
jgi:hypothetical protein